MSFEKPLENGKEEKNSAEKAEMMFDLISRKAWESVKKEDPL